MMKLFLVPASRENIEATIQGSVSIDVARKFLSSSQLNSLENALGDQKTFHCWAMTEIKRSIFEGMERHDIVLLSEKDTGTFNFLAQITHKIESETLGNYLWKY